MTRYLLVQDQDCHWYVIPSNRLPEFDAWCDIDPEDERAWTPPEYAREVGGSPRLVSFENPEISGEPI